MNDLFALVLQAIKDTTHNNLRDQWCLYKGPCLYSLKAQRGHCSLLVEIKQRTYVTRRYSLKYTSLLRDRFL